MFGKTKTLKAEVARLKAELAEAQSDARWTRYRSSRLAVHLSKNHPEAYDLNTRELLGLAKPRPDAATIGYKPVALAASAYTHSGN